MPDETCGKRPGAIDNNTARSTSTRMTVPDPEARTKGIASDDAKDAPGLTPAIQGHLGRQLRAAYGRLVNEPIPDKLTQLLDELAKKQVK